MPFWPVPTAEPAVSETEERLGMYEENPELCCSLKSRKPPQIKRGYDHQYTCKYGRAPTTRLFDWKAGELRRQTTHGVYSRVDGLSFFCTEIQDWRRTANMTSFFHRKSLKHGKCPANPQKMTNCKMGLSSFFKGKVIYKVDRMYTYPSFFSGWSAIPNKSTSVIFECACKCEYQESIFRCLSKCRTPLRQCGSGKTWYRLVRILEVAVRWFVRRWKGSNAYTRSDKRVDWFRFLIYLEVSCDSRKYGFYTRAVTNYVSYAESWNLGSLACCPHMVQTYDVVCL